MFQDRVEFAPAKKIGEAARRAFCDQERLIPIVRKELVRRQRRDDMIELQHGSLLRPLSPTFAPPPFEVKLHQCPLDARFLVHGGLVRSLPEQTL